MTKPIPFDARLVKPEVVEKLLNRELVGQTYANNSLKGAATILGTSSNLLRRMLDYHGYKPRSKGRAPDGTIAEVGEGQTITINENERTAELRRYYEDEDAGCPPNCPGLDYCYTERGCILKELVGAT